ncbi:MAG: acetyl-CoA carboxylase biotin carboxyl carrier protein [Pedosphaera sp.]|nr:acetyl-CoA carboxylase biotin carboxyl carrier protein [Pedosphaera sp.]
MDLKDIKAIIDLMKKNSLTEFEMERQDFKIKLKRGGPAGSIGAFDDGEMAAYALGRSAGSSPALGSASSPGPTPALVALPPAPANGETEIKSPMIGTFYLSPSPDSAPYSEVGAEVGPDTVVCIIEAMKVMNEIKAEIRGVITLIIAENGKPVEFGQPLFKIRPL